MITSFHCNKVSSSSLQNVSWNMLVTKLYGRFVTAPRKWKWHQWAKQELTSGNSISPGPFNWLLLEHSLQNWTNHFSDNISQLICMFFEPQFSDLDLGSSTFIISNLAQPPILNILNFSLLASLSEHLILAPMYFLIFLFQKILQEYNFSIASWHQFLPFYQKPFLIARSDSNYFPIIVFLNIWIWYN